MPSLEPDPLAQQLASALAELVDRLRFVRVAVVPQHASGEWRGPASAAYAAALAELTAELDRAVHRTAALEANARAAAAGG